ncbi:uncharacterized protein CDAR_593801 [Caerostris darwini]|uniref:Uncharacterized protein n=1 Tax=Caerostris darwini TaxID=1538125 RepID=A0AAV4RQW3_9ARAC|nr:uncharacterized protein CDAR_593801 [Caerostris darwini]
MDLVQMEKNDLRFQKMNALEEFNASPEFSHLYVSFLTNLLKANPQGLKNIYEFSTQYFETKLKERTDERRKSEKRRKTVQRDIPSEPGSKAFLPDFSYDSFFEIHPKISESSNLFGKSKEFLLNQEKHVIYHLRDVESQEQKNSIIFQKEKEKKELKDQNIKPDRRKSPIGNLDDFQEEINTGLLNKDVQPQKSLPPSEQEDKEGERKISPEENIQNKSITSLVKDVKENMQIKDIKKFIDQDDPINQPVAAPNEIMNTGELIRSLGVEDQDIRNIAKTPHSNYTKIVEDERRKERSKDQQLDFGDITQSKYKEKISQEETRIETSDHTGIPETRHLILNRNSSDIQQEDKNDSMLTNINAYQDGWRRVKSNGGLDDKHENLEGILKKTKDVTGRKQTEDHIEKQTFPRKKQPEHLMKQNMKDAEPSSGYVDEILFSENSIRQTEISQILPECIKIMCDVFEILEKQNTEECSGKSLVKEPKEIANEQENALNKSFKTISTQTDYIENLEFTFINNEKYSPAMSMYIDDVIKAAKRLLLSVADENYNNTNLGQNTDGLFSHNNYPDQTTLQNLLQIDESNFEALSSSLSDEDYWKKFDLKSKQYEEKEQKDKTQIEEDESVSPKNQKAWKSCKANGKHCFVHSRNNNQNQKDWPRHSEPNSNTDKINDNDEVYLSFDTHDFLKLNEKFGTNPKTEFMKNDLTDWSERDPVPQTEQKNIILLENTSLWELLDSEENESQQPSSKSSTDENKDNQGRITFPSETEHVCERHAHSNLNSPPLWKTMQNTVCKSCFPLIKEEENHPLKSEKRVQEISELELNSSSKEKSKGCEHTVEEPTSQSPREKTYSNLNESDLYILSTPESDKTNLDPFFMSTPILRSTRSKLEVDDQEKKRGKSAGNIPNTVATKKSRKQRPSKWLRRKNVPTESLDGESLSLLDLQLIDEKDIPDHKVVSLNIRSMPTEPKQVEKVDTNLVVHTHEATTNLQMRMLDSRHIYNEMVREYTGRNVSNLDEAWCNISVPVTGRSWLRSYLTTQVIRRYQKQWNLENPPVDDEVKELAIPVLKSRECSYGLGSYFSHRSLFGSVRTWYFSKKLWEYQKAMQS